MLFWIGLPIMLALFVTAFGFGVRGYDGRVHRPGTRRLIEGPSGRRRPSAQGRPHPRGGPGTGDGT